MMPSFEMEENPIFGGIGRGMAEQFGRMREGDMLSQIIKQAGGENADPTQLISGILGSSLSSETKKQAIDTFAAQQKVATAERVKDATRAAAAQKVADKPGVLATERLKKIGKTIEKIPSVKADLNRALELINEGVTTGPVAGLFGEHVVPSDAQKEFQGIASRALTESFDVLPRIQTEFESFKSGQLSLTNPLAVNKRIAEKQLKAVELAEAKMKRLNELMDSGVSEPVALRQADKEFDEREDALIKEVRSIHKVADKTENKTKKEVLVEARRRGLVP